MRKSKFNLGGEQSGHIIMTDYMTTGDGLAAALQFLLVLVDSGKTASEISKNFDPYPQLIGNVQAHNNINILEKDSVKRAILFTENMLGKEGRVVVRKSGTEAVIRVMVEHPDATLVKEAVKQITDEINIHATP